MDDHREDLRGTSECDGMCIPQCIWCAVSHDCPDECGGGEGCPYSGLALDPVPPAGLELGRRALRAVGHAGRFLVWGGTWLARGQSWSADDVLDLHLDGADPAPDMEDGRNMRAVLEWAREATGDGSLCVWSHRRLLRGVRRTVWCWGGDDDERGEHSTEAEAHVALAEWAAENRR